MNMSTVRWRHLQFAGGRAIPFALGSVAGRARTRKHRFARTRITLLHWSLFDHLILCDGEIRAACGQKHAGDQQAPKAWEFRVRVSFEKEHDC